MENFRVHSGIFQGKRGKTLAICIWECLMWVIWKSRNNVIFSNVEVNPIRIIDEVKGRVWSWCLAKQFFQRDISLSQWSVSARIAI